MAKLRFSLIGGQNSKKTALKEMESWLRRTVGFSLSKEVLADWWWSSQGDAIVDDDDDAGGDADYAADDVYADDVGYGNDT